MPDSSPTPWIGRVLATSPTVEVVDPFSENRTLEVRSNLSVSPGCYVSVVQRPDVSEVVEVLATPGSARAAVYDLIVERELNPSFPERVEAEVAMLLDDPGIDDADLVDLTGRPFVTVDGAYTRDLDQALWIERAGDGYRVWYALADASFYVRPGMAVFEEALRRGASFYLPGLAVPMLPRALSENLISLNAGESRRATVFRMDLDAKGQCRGTRLLRARIQSLAKLTFDEVQSLYDGPDASGLRGEPYAESLSLLREVGNLRIADAEQRDVVRYRRSEVDVGLEGEDGLRFVVLDDFRREVERYNEQLSLLCNMEGARLLFLGDRPDDNVQPIYRVHPRPRPERISEFEGVLDALARAHDLDVSFWTWKRGRGTSLAAFLAALPSEGEHAAVARAIHRQAVLLNLRSSFSEEAGEHYGVGAELYARFSSPMREIVGVFVHKEAWEKEMEGPLAPRWTAPASGPEGDDALRTTVVRRANLAKEVQSELDKVCNGLVIDRMLSRDLAMARLERPLRPGTVMGLTRSKVHVLLDTPPLDVKLYANHVAAQRSADVQLAVDGASWCDADGRPVVRLGDQVVVRLVGREERGNRWILEMV
jgi:ribonuclease R